MNQPNENLKSLVGHEVGRSPWITIDQTKVDTHGETTGDTLWIHTDHERAASESPFGGTIVQGFLLLSHLTEMAHAIELPVENVNYQLNYGFDRVRMVQPVPTGSRVRGRFELNRVEPKGHHGLLVYLDASIDIEGDDIAPAVVAEWIAYLHIET